MYKKISDYGLIGNMHTVALVSNDGSIDYCSMPDIDSPTIFAALLDDEKGGFFRIQPINNFKSKQRYIKDTNILSCEFRTEKGLAQLRDFMPVNTDKLFEKDDYTIHRCLKVVSGNMDFVLEIAPRPVYAMEKPIIKRHDNIFIIETKKETFQFIIECDKYDVLERNNDTIIINFSLKTDQAAHFSFIYGEKNLNEIDFCGFESTRKFWIDWLWSTVAKQYSDLGEYSDMINRSLLVLKLLTFKPTGAIAASATTSLPEFLGAGRNWDYRYTWIRDSSFTLKAMFALGHISEADRFIQWLHNTYKKHGTQNLKIMYSLRGESNLTEKILEHLKGYKNSKPVRIGNEASDQKQWDIYGEVMDTALNLSNYAGKIDETLWPFFKDICNLAMKNWVYPDDGIWEVRNGPFHFVYSKVMCWVALDRGIKIAKRYGFDAPLEWNKKRDEIKKDILQKGFDKELNSFVQYYGSKEVDSSLLLLGLMNFLPMEDKRIQGTINACKKYLMKNNFILRYVSNDGLQGKEGAFLLCNFWFIECLALSEKIEEARNLLKITLKAANHLGLFSEEYDFKNNEMLGNFPQAFSHIGFINAVSAILNIQNKMSIEKPRISLAKQMQKFIPVKVNLNKSDIKVSDTSKDIAVKLKVTLNNLQGAFFDVFAGKVNYEALRKSESYKTYLELAAKLNAFNPSVLKTDDEKKAFWINVYNILIINGVIYFNIKKSVKEVFNFFNRIGYSIGDMYFSPDNIEHGILRSNRPHPGSGKVLFSSSDKRNSLIVNNFDCRIHFALVCAASSCPPIEFYDASKIDEQLDVAGRSFVNRRGVAIDKENNEVYLSQIFKWYAEDFGKNTNEVLKYAVKFTDKNTREFVLNNIRKVTVKYSSYDWNLNALLV